MFTGAEPITRMRMAASLCDGLVGAREQILLGEGWDVWWGWSVWRLSAQHGGVPWVFGTRNVTHYWSNIKAI